MTHIEFRIHLSCGAVVGYRVVLIRNTYNTCLTCAPKGRLVHAKSAHRMYIYVHVHVHVHVPFKAVYMCMCIVHVHMSGDVRSNVPMCMRGMRHVHVLSSQL